MRSALVNLPSQRLCKATRTIARRGSHIRELTRVFTGDVHVLRYEDLVTEPESACRALCSFLEFPFDGAMLDFHRGNEGGRLLLQSTKSIHSNTMAPMNAGYIGQWQRDAAFSEADVRYIETTLEEFMDQHGYKRSLS